MSTINVDWSAIRPLNGSRAQGFEELCTQLARHESPAGSRFERNGPPDAGVECFATLGDGSEWGWQAKYFHSFGDSQWSQLDESVKTALQKHPQLVRYFVCVPTDLPDARIEDRKSARERWNDHVQKWLGWASARPTTIEFVYWGSHELLDRLALPQHVGMVRFWFDARAFDVSWFHARLEEAVKTAGPRYTPEINVELPIATDFESFGRTDRFFDQVKAHARSLRKKLESVRYSGSENPDAALDASLSAVSVRVQAVLTDLGTLTVQPIGVVPFRRIAERVASAESSADELERLLKERERAHDAEHPTTGRDILSSSDRDKIRRCHQYLSELSDDLERTREVLQHSEDVAGRSLMILTGAAGTGKTHLLCDTARQRVEAGRPTVLLMGQRFVSLDPPWTQVMQQLDLEGLSAEEFVGALGAAAQAADSRALVMIDAMNEGTGRLLWPNHLAAFLAHLGRSPWIGVVLAVRSSYEEIVIPEEIRADAVTVTHEGFADREYDATRTFFVHYGLELPSTPLLEPEFRNPLFLKTLCQGLNAKGERRLPRGFQGVTAVFDLYLEAINDRLGSVLGFNPKHALVRQAVERFAGAAMSGRWLTLGRAEEVVNALLPGRDFERSLYRGLIGEGVLVEDAVRHRESIPEDVVYVAYDRLADHLVAKSLLDAHLDLEAPESAFGAGGPLAFLSNKTEYVASGLLEAMCVQVVERTGIELFRLAPGIAERWGIVEAFLRSLIWRAPTAFPARTLDLLTKSIREGREVHDLLNVLMTLSTIPGHPLNGNFLDARLRECSMPDRDAWWSVFLHESWQYSGAVHRVVDWAWSVSSSTVLDDAAVDLCAAVLSWMLSSSNRYLRDRATKALVNLLTGRLGSLLRMVERFADVDDPYILERIYAVAYGTSMRCQEPMEVAALAQYVYSRVFAGKPPAHILLRDYARGVVERAIYLGANIDIVPERIRPPYESQWPSIPTEEEIKPLLPDWSRGSHDSGDTEWARNRIGSSVMSDDFARYVIGTNSGLTNWLSLRRGEAEWQSPYARKAAIIREFSEEEKSAWDNFTAADDEVRRLSFNRLSIRLIEDAGGNTGGDEECGSAPADEPDSELQKLQEARAAALLNVEKVLTDKHWRDLNALLTEEAEGTNARRAPRFDLRVVQRYILWRVFNLGWTTERFGRFDRFSIGYHGRAARKAERIGKKYQWIAYHEIMALVADHFQYREKFREDEGDHAYDGPWQEYLRDIDPSCTLRSSLGGTFWDAHAPAWWARSTYDGWTDPDEPKQWVIRSDNLPRIEELLAVKKTEDLSCWLNLQGYFQWDQPVPADLDWMDVERRELSYSITSYLIRADEAEVFIRWARNVDLSRLRMPVPPQIYRLFLGEHGWSPAAKHFEGPDIGDSGWTQPGQDCPMKFLVAALGYVQESSGFDCSVDEGFTLQLPSQALLIGLGLRCCGKGADYVLGDGQLAAFDPAAHAEGPSALLVKEDVLRQFLAREGLTVCWAISGEKRVLAARFDAGVHAALHISGAYILGDKGPLGFLNYIVEEGQEGEEVEEGEPTEPPPSIEQKN